MLILVGVGVTAAAALLIVFARRLWPSGDATNRGGDDVGAQLVCVAITALIAIGIAVLVMIAASGGGGVALVEAIIAGAVMLAFLAFAFVWRVPAPPKRR